MLDEKRSTEEAGNELRAVLNKARESFIEAMEDDLNTADALGAIFECVREINTYFADRSDGANEAKEALCELCNVLGLDIAAKDEIPQEIIDLCEERVQAKKDKDFAKSDMLRDKIKEMGYTVKDTRDGYSLIKD